MILRLSFILLVCAFTSASAQKQPSAMTFQNAEMQGIKIAKLDSIYKSAVDTDPNKAVFKTSEEQKELRSAYTTLLNDLQKHLTANNFKWENPTRCFNRIYFRPNGKIDYFLYNFIVKANDPNPISTEKRMQFEKLLATFVKKYQFKLRSDVKFAQCSPVIYRD